MIQRIYHRFYLPLLLMAIACVIVIFNGSVLSQNTPLISIKYQYYTIHGATASQLQSQLFQLGPLDKRTGGHYAGYTHWYVKWNYRYQPQGNLCKVSSLKVKSDVIFTMPKWLPAENTPVELRGHWQRYVRSLQNHENGHKDHGINAAKEILRTLNGLTTSSCQQIVALIDQKSKAIIKKYSQEDIEYDRVTQHGRTQGAVFP